MIQRTDCRTDVISDVKRVGSQRECHFQAWHFCTPAFRGSKWGLFQRELTFLARHIQPVGVPTMGCRSRYVNPYVVLLICAHLLRLPLGGKYPRYLLRKTLNLFLFNCERMKIDHGDFKDSDYIRRRGFVNPTVMYVLHR